MRISPIALCFLLASAEPLTLGLEQGGATSLEKFEFYPPGSQRQGQPVVLSFKGHIYGPDGKPTARFPEEKLVPTLVETYRTGTPDDVLRFWEEAEHSKLRAFAADKKTWDQNRRFYENVEATLFVARIEYGTFVVSIVRHRLKGGQDSVKGYPFKKVGDNWLLSNDLSNDPVFQYFVSRYTRDARNSKDLK